MTDQTTPPEGQGGQTAATTTTGATASTTSTDAPFYDSFTNPELKTWTGAKGFKSPETMAESLLNMEKAMGAPRDRLVVLPEKSDDPKWNEIHERLGRPKTAAEYNIPLPEGDLGVFAGKAKEAMFKHNLTADQAKGLAEWWNAEGAAMQEAQENELVMKSDAELKQLHSEWGSLATEKEAIARAAAKEFFNLDGDAMTAVERSMGSRAFMEAMVKIGEKLGEAKFITGDTGEPANSKTKALQEIETLKKDKDFYAAMTDKKHLRHAESKDRWDKLNQSAYG
jgi:hypothetical protein